MRVEEAESRFWEEEDMEKLENKPKDRPKLKIGWFVGGGELGFKTPQVFLCLGKL